MKISEILAGDIMVASSDEQKSVLEEMKEQKIFDLNESEKTHLIDFLCERKEPELAIDYLFHVLDTEIAYPIDDDKVKTLFSDDRMRKMKDLMMEKLQDEEISDEEVSEETEQ
jgi:hypothetical protein